MKVGKVQKLQSNITVEDLELLFLLTSKQQLKSLIIEKIKPISSKQQNDFHEKLRTVIQKRYLSDHQNQQFTKIIIHDIVKFVGLFKDIQLVSPTADWFIEQFIRILKIYQESNFLQKKDLISLWDTFPTRKFENFIQALSLQNQFRNQQQQKVMKILYNLVNNNKLGQSCLYYSFYKQVPEFEKNILLPKLITNQQQITPMILKLLKSRDDLKKQVIAQLDPARSLTILENLNDDPRNYPEVNNFILRKHYISIVKEYNQWFILQDKMSFNKVFIQWLCEQQNIAEQIRQSIKFRNGIGGVQEFKKNPLYEKDQFSPIEIIFPELIECFEKKKKRTQITPINEKFQQEAKNNRIQQQYVCLSQFDIKEQNVHFVSSCDTKQFHLMKEQLQKCLIVGFDAQYRFTSTKYQQSGVSIIQISTREQIFILDFIILEKEQQFIQFFAQILSNPEFIIVGHSINSDIRYIEKTMKIDNVEGVVDIAKIFKLKFPNQNQSSLSFISNYLLGKKLSKYEQRSNWNRRPLKKTQIHYAALDAKICLVIHDILKQKDVMYTNEFFFQKKKVMNNIIRKQNLVYPLSESHLLKKKKPCFLVDSMLKRLCTLMRNLGIDTEYVPKTDFSLMQEIAFKQSRIILTKDHKLFDMKNHKVPMYYILEKGDSQSMLQQVKKNFDINYTQYQPLSRCVKCNCDLLIVIQKQQALKYLNFQHEDNRIQEFWRCNKCKQIYWEGNQWKNAKNKFKNME